MTDYSLQSRKVIIPSSEDVYLNRIPDFHLSTYSDTYTVVENNTGVFSGGTTTVSNNYNFKNYLLFVGTFTGVATITVIADNILKTVKQYNGSSWSTIKDNNTSNRIKFAVPSDTVRLQIEPANTSTTTYKDFSFTEKSAELPIGRIYLGSNLIYGSSAAPSTPTYTYLQYAESTGASVITDFYPDSNTAVLAYIKSYPGTGGGGVFIGNTQTPETETDAFRIFKYQNVTYLDYGSGQGYNRMSINYPIPESGAITVGFGNRYLAINGYKIINGNTTTFSQKSYPIKIFSSTDYGQVRYVKIYSGTGNESGTLARDYRAVIRDTDNKVGMLDELTGTFIEPTGGSWTAGPVLTT